jgi:hypothetical protein
MVTEGSINLEKQETLPMTPDEFAQRLKLLMDTESQLINRETIKGEDLYSGIRKLRSDFVEKLLLEKERFNKVFKTANGSVYFILETGETIRAKMVVDKYEFDEGDGQHFMFSPLMNNLFFLPQDESERLARVEDLSPGEKIKTVPYGLRVVPFEINIRGFGSQVVFENNSGELLLIGTQTLGAEELDTEGNLVGTHLGHPIIEIVK